MLDDLQISQWWQRVGEIAVAREVVIGALLQLLLIAAMLGAAWAARAATRPLTDRFAERTAAHPRFGHLGGELRGPLVILAYAWLLLVIAERVGAEFGLDLRLVGVAATLSALWIVLRASVLLFRDALLAHLVAVAAWIVAALNITGLLAPTAAALDSAALTIGTVRLSLLVVVKAVLLVAILMWAALALSRLIGVRIQRLALSPSLQSLTRNLATIVLVSLALLIGLNTVGIDLTALTVFSGAIGVGLGFGLQKIVSNFVSGIILLAEHSIRPGDVIEVGSTYGVVIAIGARYASVHGRDGKLYMIPNETLITNQVINWSGSTPLLRLDITFPASYEGDLRELRRIAIEAARQTKRVVATPAPVCHITEFADNGVNLLLRFWIEDPENGVKNVRGDVYLALWEAFRARGIVLPNPASEILIREVPVELTRAAAE